MPGGAACLSFKLSKPLGIWYTPGCSHLSAAAQGADSGCRNLREPGSGCAIRKHRQHRHCSASSSTGTQVCASAMGLHGRKERSCQQSYPGAQAWGKPCEGTRSELGPAPRASMFRVRRWKVSIPANKWLHHLLAILG